jgi:hypothetical protein
MLLYYKEKCSTKLSRFEIYRRLLTKIYLQLIDYIFQHTIGELKVMLLIFLLYILYRHEINRQRTDKENVVFVSIIISLLCSFRHLSGGKPKNMKRSSEKERQNVVFIVFIGYH